MLESNGREDFREAGSYLVYEDVEQAKEILKKAGYGKNRPLPQITILYNTSELHKAIAEAVQMLGSMHLVQMCAYKIKRQRYLSRPRSW